MLCGDGKYKIGLVHPQMNDKDLYLKSKSVKRQQGSHFIKCWENIGGINESFGHTFLWTRYVTKDWINTLKYNERRTTGNM